MRSKLQFEFRWAKRCTTATTQCVARYPAIDPQRQWWMDQIAMHFAPSLWLVSVIHRLACLNSNCIFLVNFLEDEVKATASRYQSKTTPMTIRSANLIQNLFQCEQMRCSAINFVYSVQLLKHFRDCIRRQCES